MQFSQLPWWRTDAYNLEGAANGPDLDDKSLWGPEGPSLVQYFPDTGKTGPGWGRDTFMNCYRRQLFNPRRVLASRDPDSVAYAYVMRGSKLVCVDIDGKNGGLEYASQLGYLPPTTSEVSKSGTGYHLFYLVEDEWDPQEGFGRYRDAIGIVPGVDIRGTGCVYHVPTQRWNGRTPAKLPEFLSTMLLERQNRKGRESVHILKTLELDIEEIIIMQSELLTELNKPIPTGKRNSTLFAIGSKLLLAEVPNWEQEVLRRAGEVGLDDVEAEKIVENINTYGRTATP